MQTWADIHAYRQTLKHRTTQELEAILHASPSFAPLIRRDELSDDNVADKLIHRVKLEARLSLVGLRLKMFIEQGDLRLIETYNECLRCGQINGDLIGRYEEAARNRGCPSCIRGPPVWPVNHFQRTRRGLQEAGGDWLAYIDKMIHTLQAAINTLSRCADQNTATRPRFPVHTTEAEYVDQNMLEYGAVHQSLAEMLINLLAHERSSMIQDTL